MSDAVEITFRADLAELESGTEEAAALIERVTGEMLRIFEQASLKEIAIAEDRNNFLYRMGEESLEQWKANATAEENAKYEAEVAWLDKKSAADKDDAAAEARDLAERQLLHQEHALALQKIDEQYAEKKRAIDQEELSEFVSAENARLQDGLKTISEEYTQHQISAQERYTLEQQLTAETYGEELKRLDALIATLTSGTKAYEDAIKQREKIEQEFAKQSESNTNQLTTEEMQKWNTLSSSIRSSFNSALNGMILGTQSWRAALGKIIDGVANAFLEMGEKMLEDWIETEIMKQVVTRSTDGATAVGEISAAAGVAGANAYAAYAAFPPLAAAMAAEAVATTMSFTSLVSLDAGAWNLRDDTVAQLHKGEMVVPENFASGMRSGRGIGGGDTHHWNYSPTVLGEKPFDLMDELSNRAGEFQDFTSRLVRDGALRFAR